VEGGGEAHSSLASHREVDDEAREQIGHCCPWSDPGSWKRQASRPWDWNKPCVFLGFQSKTLAELEDIFTETAEAQELASGIGDAAEARQWLRTKLQAVGEKAGFAGIVGEALEQWGSTWSPHPPFWPQGCAAQWAWCLCS
jgi:hypothetical protein